MQIAIQVSNMGKQGRPAFSVGNRQPPDTVDVNLPKDAARGELMYATQELFSVHGSGPGTENATPSGGTMSRSLELSMGTEAYQSKYKTKWTEPNPLAGRSDGVLFGSSSVPRETLGKVTISAYDLDKQHDLVNGAHRLLDILDWLEFCMIPWTELGQPPLLHVTVGVRSFYGYIEDFDPQVTEWLHDHLEGGRGLPSEAAFSLNFIREPDPMGLFKKKDLPETNYKIIGGSGGLTGGLVTVKGLESGNSAAYAAFQRQQAVLATAAQAQAAKELKTNPALVKGFKALASDQIPPGGAAAKPPAGTGTGAGASNNPQTRTTAVNTKTGKVIGLDPKQITVTTLSASTQAKAAAQGSLGQGIGRVVALQNTALTDPLVTLAGYVLPNGLTVPTVTLKPGVEVSVPTPTFGVSAGLPSGPSKQTLIRFGVNAGALENYLPFDPNDRATWPTSRFR